MYIMSLRLLEFFIKNLKKSEMNQQPNHLKK